MAQKVFQILMPGKLNKTKGKKTEQHYKEGRRKMNTNGN